MFASLACKFTWLPWHQTNLKLNTRAFNVVLRSTHMSTQNTNIPRMWTDSGKTHPWRPRGSQSSQEKRPDESFHYGRKSPWVPTLTGPFPKIQADAGSWLGTKNALYYFAQSANTSQWVLFVCLYITAIVSITACLAHAPKKCMQSGNFQFDIKSPSDPTCLLVKCKRTLLSWISINHIQVHEENEFCYRLFTSFTKLAIRHFHR